MSMTHEEELSAINKGREEMYELAKQVFARLLNSCCSNYETCRNPIMREGAFNNDLAAALNALRAADGA